MVKSMLVGICVVLSAGCSFGMSGVSQLYTPDRAPLCDASSSAPVADIVGATASVVTVLGSAAASSFCSFHLFNAPPEDEVRACESKALGMAAIGAIAAVTYVVAAASGFHKRGTCIEARRAHLDWKHRGSKPLPERGAELPPGAVVPQASDCLAWKQRLAAATSTSEKLALVKVRPNSCR